MPTPAAIRTELRAIADQAADHAVFLRLAETLTSFLARLRTAAETLNVAERQRIVRLVVKEVLIGDDTITIRHSIPIPSGPPPDSDSKQYPPSGGQSLLLCRGRDFAVAVEPCSRPTGPRVGATRAPIRTVRGRLQHLCSLPLVHNR